jgi:hypothetical protein
MKHSCISALFAGGLLTLALAPVAERWRETSWMTERLEGLEAGKSVATADMPSVSSQGVYFLPNPDPTLLVRVEEIGALLASWQTVGGCGAGSGGGSSVGLKWIGRNVTGGLFNVQEQVSYTKLGSTVGGTDYPEYNFFFNTLITADVGEKWNFGINLPIVYKYLVDPNHVGSQWTPAVDYSNSGVGDISLLATRRLGRINSLSLTGIVGFPTGVYDVRYSAGGKLLNQSQQIGFGEPTGSLILDQTLDQVWGLIVVGGAAAWRGGENKIHNYRAPSGTLYGYAGYFLGPFVPAFGLSITGFTGHDRDQDAIQTTPLYSAAANLSIEWSTAWLALLVAASFPYGYDGIKLDENGQARSPWRLQPWTVSLGVAAAPF